MRECNAPCWTAFTCVDSRLHGSGVRSPPLHCAPGCTAPGWTESSRIGEMKLNRCGLNGTVLAWGAQCGSATRLV